MSKYRIIKTSMIDLIGKASFYGIKHAYMIEKKTWYGKWKLLDVSVNLKEAENILQLARTGKLSNKGSEIIKEV